MDSCGNLCLERVDLRAGDEWVTNSGPWRFLRLSEGEAYWLGQDSNRLMIRGELVVLAPMVGGAVRASILGPAALHFFSFLPDSVWGLFSMTQGQYLAEKARVQGKRIILLPSTHPAAQRLEAVVGGRVLSACGLAQRVELLSIAVGILDEAAQPHVPPPGLGISALDRFQRLIADLPDLELANRTASELAALCGCSVGHFHRLFRSRFRVSFRRRQAQVRNAVEREQHGALAEPNPQNMQKSAVTEFSQI